MSQNRLPTATRGGASSQPTPANNSGGGSGWGDEGHPKGGGAPTASDEISSDILTPPEFRTIAQQKAAAERKFMSRWDEGHDEREGTCATEDHSFAGSKPGGSDTLPGWGIMKDKLGL
ncbi:hypothetical protein BO94DRAFT_625329 [Aspergillus sclerotioniger CBS 115572]|uniref:Uncharacterized protein n=1 Tax=Aspergillus sclerotioniger CBS 115572 TaxID=1450535 RepID=A0A317WEU6_9EURO|nr:hypothetical protein BO94DRAFT_625329 [Aspergillus sclerotioniger CBS 115572]PWY83742.1 hypothetical protein BO94DRAFT_625329 [Aspergillus sclerotioniger CBS 115572]